MKQAYSIISNLSQKAITILENNNIHLTINASDNIPNTEQLITLLQKYDILIIGVKTIVPKDILN
ncbi:MAG: hypothetical protein K2J20_06085, partial [Bacilli bacterium]|nr:hypothetical protein [Bacilli bacterium]